ncbi:MAG: LysM peptidoglycan-binding domain-containing protein [Bacteroidales bacterium]|nr:LysM peptidoglycan-binding domain-containing protein [Bacteroidales bacterium]
MLKFNVKSLLFFTILMSFIWLGKVYAQQDIPLSETFAEYNGKNYCLHTVGSKQTLYSISKAYKVTVESVLMSNPEARAGLRVNQILRIPVSSEAITPVSLSQAEQPSLPITEAYDYIYHVAVKNQTFSYIANIYVVSENLVRTANPRLSDPIPEGEYVIVPIAPKTKPSTDLTSKRSDFNPYETPAKRKADLELAGQGADKTQKTSSQQNKTAKTDTKSAGSGAVASTPQIAETSPAIIWPEVDYPQHVVKPKETLYAVAKKYNLSVALLREANPGLGEDIKVGQVLRLPSSAKKTDGNSEAIQDTATVIHIVKKGETLYRIALNNGVSIDELKKANPGLNEHMQPGQKILIPKKKIAFSYIDHRVLVTEKSVNLAAKYGLSLTDLQRINPKIGKKVKVGDVVRIPLPVRPSPISPEISAEKSDNESKNPANAVRTQDHANEPCDGQYAYRNKVFKVALMVPFYLKPHDTLRITPDSDLEALASRQEFAFMGFYEGFMLSIDSLAKTAGLNAQVYVFDVDQDPAKTTAVLNNPVLNQVDLIVGPFFNKSFEQVSAFANKHQILIVNPFTQRSEILTNNPYVVKLKPSAEDQHALVAAMVAQYYPKARIFLFQPGGGKQTPQIGQLRQALDKLIPERVYIPNEVIYNTAIDYSKRNTSVKPSVKVEGKTFDTELLHKQLFDSTLFNNAITEYSYVADSLHGLHKNLSTVRENVVIVYAEDNVFAMEFMNKLNQIGDSANIRLIGLPYWDKYENLFTESLLKLKMHYLVQGFVNYRSLETEQFIHDYRAKYYGEPDTYACEGFDVGWYFMQALMHFDRDVSSCLPGFSTHQLQSNYVFKRKGDNDGLENVYWTTYRFDAFSLTPMPLYFPYLNYIR